MLRLLLYEYFVPGTTSSPAVVGTGLRQTDEQIRLLSTMVDLLGSIKTSLECIAKDIRVRAIQSQDVYGATAHCR